MLNDSNRLDWAGDIALNGAVFDSSLDIMPLAKHFRRRNNIDFYYTWGVGVLGVFYRYIYDFGTFVMLYSFTYKLGAYS